MRFLSDQRLGELHELAISTMSADALVPALDLADMVASIRTHRQEIIDLQKEISERKHNILMAADRISEAIVWLRDDD